MRTALRAVVSAFLMATALLQGQPTGAAPGTMTIDEMKHLLEVAQRRGQLDLEGGAAFHLVASYEQFDAAGKSTGKGSLDELWENPKRYRQILTVPQMEEYKLPNGGQGFRQLLDKPARQLMEVDNGTQGWRTGKWVIFSEFPAPVLQPMALRSTVTDRLSGETPPATNSALDCIGTEPDLPGVGSDTRLALTTYCLAKGNHLLKLILLPNGKSISFNDIQAFGDNQYIPRSIEVRIAGRIRLRMHVDTLEPATDFAALEVPIPEGAQVLAFHRADHPPALTGELMRGQLLSKVSPLYPQAGLRGTITVKLHVDTSGAVESEDVLEAENQILKAPVLAALKQWRFRVSYQGMKLVPADFIYRFSYCCEELVQ